MEISNSVRKYKVSHSMTEFPMTKILRIIEPIPLTPRLMYSASLQRVARMKKKKRTQILL